MTQANTSRGAELAALLKATRKSIRPLNAIVKSEASEFYGKEVEIIRVSDDGLVGVIDFGKIEDIDMDLLEVLPVKIKRRSKAA